MKICFISPRAYQLFNPEVISVFGGAEVQVSLLAKQFGRNKDLDVVMMVADFGQLKVEEIEGVKLYKSINFNQGIIAQILSFFLTFIKINADVYIQRTITPYSALFGIFCRLWGKKFIYMVAHNTETDRTHRFFTSKAKQWIMEKCFRFAHLVIVQNDYQKRNLQEKHNRESVLIRSGYPITSSSAKNIDSGKYHLWIGRAEKWKRPLLLIELAKQYPGEKFVMICPQIVDGSKEYYQEIQSQAQDTPNISFIPFVPFHEVDAYFRQAKTFINTSTAEGFPNTFIQAAKNATPILSLNVNPDNILTQHQIGVAYNDDFATMKLRFNSMVSDREKYALYSKQAIEYAQNHHNIDTTSGRLFELIQSN